MIIHNDGLTKSLIVVNINLMQAGQKLRRWRESFDDFPQRRAAELLGCDPALWSRWEAGLGRPGPLLRVMLERFTDGAVNRDDWLTAAERRRLGRVTAYSPEAA